jgi:hypothetical protein
VKRLGVIGTMVWDTIYGRGPREAPVEEWGGIAYALAGLESSLPEGWEIVPLIKVGRDMATPANAFLQSLTHRSVSTRFIEVPEPNNRVTLRYESLQRRTERLTGGVPPWRWEELRPLVDDVDAIYLNFISGFEVDLSAARQLRDGFTGPIYADLHSLLLGVTHQGDRFPQQLTDVPGWFSCFDAAQMNEDELSLIASDPMTVAAAALDAGVGLLVVTLGAGGAVYFASRPFSFARGGNAPTGPIETARVPAPGALDEGDTTGCGDVFGAVLVSQLLSGTEIPTAVAEANAQATRNMSHRGATNLHYYLRGEIAPR